MDRTDSGQTKAVRFFGNMLDGIAACAVETVVGLVMLPVQLTGLAGPQQQKQAAYGLLNLAVIIGSKPYQDTQVYLYDPVTDTVTRGDRYLYMYMMGMGKAFLAWDEWGSDPGTAAGTVVFNIGSFFVPGGAAVKGGSAAAKAGAGARMVGTAAKAEEAAGAAARATAVVRAAEEATAAARTVGVASDITVLHGPGEAGVEFLGMGCGPCERGHGPRTERRNRHPPLRTL